MLPGQGLNSTRRIDVDQGVKLLGEARLEVVTLALAFGKVDDADGALEARLPEDLRQLSVISERKQEFAEAGIVKKIGVAALEGRSQLAVFARSVPISRGYYTAGIGGKAHEYDG